MRTIPNVQSIFPQQVEVEKMMVCLVDRSGSMEGSKEKSATQFVRDAFKLAKSEGFTAFKVVEFSTLLNHCSNKFYDLSKSFDWNSKSSNGKTPLYISISQLITSLKDYTGKVLINVISDGEDTEGGLKYVKMRIEEFIESGQTITFICVEKDKINFIKIGVPESNIQTYDNTGKGIENSFRVYKDAVSNYSKSVAKGEDVTRGFYKSVKN